MPVYAQEGALPHLAGQGAVLDAPCAVAPDAVIFAAAQGLAVYDDVTLAGEAVTQQRGVVGVDVEALVRHGRRGQAHHLYAGAGVQPAVGADEFGILDDGP